MLDKAKLIAVGSTYARAGAAAVAALYLADPSRPLKDYVAEIEDYDLAKSDPEKFIKNTFFSGHHLIGGCADLVDENFEVRENPGIFVCDASVFSEFVSSNIHAPVVILAKLFCDRYIERSNCNNTGMKHARI